MGRIKLDRAAYVMKPEEVVTALKTDVVNGLTTGEVSTRLKLYGPNRIERKDKKGAGRILFSQVKSPIVWILGIAAALSYYFGEGLNTFSIVIVIAINTAIGFFMEFQAERSMNALKKMSTIQSKVLRGGALEEVNSESIVPGDMVYLEAGDLVPADGRIISATQLQLDESAMTGESVPVEKSVVSLPADTLLADRINVVYKGTFSTKGNGWLAVTETGADTEFGKIANLVQSADQSATPLEKNLEDFSRKLIRVTVALVVLIFIAGVLNGQNYLGMLETSIALAVAAIPEGLPIVATIALAHGMLKMAKYNVVVKKLSAVETLGGTNVICTDKTGTLTKNKIEVSIVIPAAENPEVLETLDRVAVLCNTAELRSSEGVLAELGDPLETGLLLYGLKRKIDIQAYRTRFHKVKEEPFSSESKVMATLHRTEDGLTVYAKGAPEEILKLSDRIAGDGAISVLTAEQRALWLMKSDQLSATGLKVIAAGFKPDAQPEDNLEADLVFAGLFGMIDPPREEVFGAIEECRRAGVNVIMITGDHPATARNIALKLGIADSKNCEVIAGSEMKEFHLLSDEEKSRWINTRIFARVSPRQKLDLISVLQEKKYVVGMTGDGVNDAPALKKADIGIAMGIRGTQVSQEVADMILKDDSFSSIVIAIRQGRVIFDNIRKFVVFLLSCNLSELLVIAIASIFSLHFQLFPLQILFINLITDVFPALALGLTSGNPDIMNRRPGKLSEPILDRKRWITILLYAAVIGGVSIGSVLVSHLALHNSETWNRSLCNNMLFFTLIFSQLLHALNMGSSDSGFFSSEVFRNKLVWAAISFSVVVLITTYTIEPFRNALSLNHMSAADWLVALSAGVVSTIIIQVLKKLKIAVQ